MYESGKTSSFSVNKTQCCVRYCESAGYKTPNITFHSFPIAAQSFVNIKNHFGVTEKIDQKKAWEKVLLINKKWSTTNKKVCSSHFKAEDYVLSDPKSTIERLKKTAVPSINLPRVDDKINEEKKRKMNERTERLLTRESKRKRSDEISQQPDLERVNNVSLTNEEITGLHETEDLEENSSASFAIPEPNDEHNSTNADDEDETGRSVEGVDLETETHATDDDIISMMITNNQELSTVTGIPNFEVLQILIDIANIVAPHMKSHVLKLSVRNRVIMTFMKLKHNVSYALLTVIFKLCSVENCRKTVFRMLDVLSSGLKFAINWPTKDEVSKNIPLCFKDFADVRVVIDCIEIFIEKPKNLCCQLATYSHYKSGYTVKLMTGVSPGGIITFVSRAYGGRSSDKAIFEQSRLITLVGKHEAIMVDKGFLIDDICKNNDIKLIRPPFLRKKKQYSAQEALLNAKIAKARVHIERSNERLKKFKILGSKIPSALVPRIDRIFTIICAVVNLSSSILADDKFVS